MNDIFTPAIVDGMKFAVKWQDFGTYLKINVFHKDEFIGSKKFPVTTDRGEGVIAYTIRSLLIDRQYEIH